jgi:hypothetical protein
MSHILIVSVCLCYVTAACNNNCFSENRYISIGIVKYGLDWADLYGNKFFQTLFWIFNRNQSNSF